MWTNDTIEYVSEFSRNRMSKKHREPEIPEEEILVVECLDGLAKITSKELAITHFVKNGTLQRTQFWNGSEGGEAVWSLEFFGRGGRGCGEGLCCQVFVVVLSSCMWSLPF